jgi:ComF family protein
VRQRGWVTAANIRFQKGNRGVAVPMSGAVSITALFRGLVDLLAPRGCVACDLPLDDHETIFCGGCAPLVEEAPAGHRPPASAAAAYVHAGPLADAVRRYKYGPRPELAGPLGALLAAAARPLAGRVDVVVPMPLHPHRLRARGFDQAALLAHPVARILAVPCRTGALVRVRETPPQAGLDARGRADNVRGAFRVRRPALLRGLRVLLIDDVRTTGATLAAASEALCEAHVAEVRTLTLAFAERDA